MHGTRIYLDNNATTCILPEVADLVCRHWQTEFANPGSQHSFGRDARRVLEDSREQLAELLNADASELVFTSGGTESVNAAVSGFTLGRSGCIALTAGEHPAVRQACERARQAGYRLLTLDVDHTGKLIEAQWASLPWHELRLVCVILAHNETGVVQNVEHLSELCRQHRVPLLLDAVQAVGRIPVSFQKLGAAAIAFGAHKFHGPRGIGGLLLRRGIRIPPFLEGGHQEHGRRAGTEAVGLIAGMTHALAMWQQSCPADQVRVTALRDELQNRLTTSCAPANVHGIDAVRLPNTLSVAFPGVPGEALLVNLDLAGVACSLGSACASGSAEPAPGLLAMGLPTEICRSSVRFSLSRLNTIEEIEEAAARVAQVVRRMRDEAAERNEEAERNNGRVQNEESAFHG